MSITIQNLRIIPYGQKDVIKPVFGDTMKLAFSLPDHEAGDNYTLALDYERILLPTMRPLCAMATEYTAAGTNVSFELEISTERFAQWVSRLKKPTPIWLQLQRERGGVYTTILLDDVLALPSVVDGANMVFPGTPLEDKLAKKLDKPTEAGQAGNVLKLGEDGKPVWGDGGGGGSAQQATDAEIDARESTSRTITPNNLDYAVRSVLPNVTTIPAATTAYSLLDASATTNNHSWQYFHAPEAASTYVFPAVTDDSVAHRIKLTIDFTAVQTYAFEDSEGTAITPLFTPTISAGDVYEFDCEYSAVKSQWLIWPHKQGAVSDDYVMQSQVGAANGVAPLDSNALVPRANLPIGGDAKRGVLQTNGGFGTKADINGYIQIFKASREDIDARTQGYRPIVPTNLNYAVAAALTDAKKIQLTDAQKASAQDTLGAAPAPIVFTTAGDAPTTSTVGTPGRRAVNTADGKAWTCTAVTVDDTDPQNPVTTYTWVDDINANGGNITGPLQFVTGTWSVGINKYNIVAGASLSSVKTGSIQVGYHTQGTQNYQIVGGEYNTNEAGLLIIGNGNSVNATSNALLLSKSGNLYIAGGHQQGITVIPPATTAYTLAEGMQSHVPEAASLYVVPTITDATRTHEIILTVRFSSSVLTYAFEDSAGNPITPLPLAGTIADGSVVAFRCTWEALLNQWVIMPVMLGTYQEAEP